MRLPGGHLRRNEGDGVVGSGTDGLDLIELGHTHIAHLLGEPKVSTAQPRLQGYPQAMPQAGLSTEPDWMVPAKFGWKDGYTATLQLWQLPENKRPTACSDPVITRR